jgi:Sec-independent protein translocase protein TatA
MARLVVVALVSLMLFGPQDLPKLARLVGRAMAELHRMAADFTELIHKLEAIDAEEAPPPHNG